MDQKNSSISSGVKIIAFLTILALFMPMFIHQVPDSQVGVNDEISRIITPNFVSPVSDNNLDYRKIDGPLSNWVETKILSDNINLIDNKASIMLMISGDDYTLGGKIEPYGVVPLAAGTSWVQATIKDLNSLKEIMNMPNVLKIEADMTKSSPQKITSIDDLKQIKSDIESFVPPEFPMDWVINNTRDVLGVPDVWDLGYDGSGVMVQVHDTGLDFGHTVYKNTMALDSNNIPMSLDAAGRMSVTSLFSGFAPLHADGSGFIQLPASTYNNLIVFLPDLGYDDIVWADLQYNFGVPDLPAFNVNGLPGDVTGFAFGISAIHNGGWLSLVPFLEADSDDDGTYDTLYVDYETGWLLTQRVHGRISSSDYNILVNPDFSTQVAHKNDLNQELSKDVLDPRVDFGDLLAGFGQYDGYTDISIGSLANVYDINDYSGNTIPIVTGIDPAGEVLGHLWDTGGHGTGCAGYINAQPTEYALLDQPDHPDSTMYNISGMAPGAKVLSTPGLSQSATLYGWLWAAGFEPDEDSIWSFNPASEHIVNMSSNSWGYSYMHIGGVAMGWDFETMFIDLLSAPGYLDPAYPGVLYLTSSGNGGPGIGSSKQPGQSMAALTIGASTTNFWRNSTGYNASAQGYDQVIGWSDNGPTTIGYPKLDVVAPGAFDFSLAPVVVGGDYEWNDYYFYYVFGGTSASCPVVAGAAALFYEAWATNVGTQLAPGEAKSILKSTSKDLGYDVYMQGNGRIDAKRAVEYALGIPDVLMASNNESYATGAERYEIAFYKYFNGTGIKPNDITNVTLASGSNEFPGFTESILDNGIYGGSLLPGESYEGNFTVNGTFGSLDYEDFTFETTYSTVNSSTELHTMGNYTAFKLRDLFDYTQIQSADYFQLTMAQTPEDAEAYRDEDNRPAIMYISSLESNVSGEEDWSFHNYAYGENNFHTLFLPTGFIQDGEAEVYLRVRDYNYQDAIVSWTGKDFMISVRAFTRVDDTTVVVTQDGPDTFHATITVPGAAIGGMYEGYIKINSSDTDPLLIPYGYSVLTEVSDIVENGWTTIEGITNRPNDNGFYGSADWSWRPETGDWRFYDFILNYTNIEDVKSLLVDVNWTLPGTEVNVWIVDHEGVIVGETDYVTSAGQYISDVNSPPTNQRMLLEMRQYSGIDPDIGDVTEWCQGFTTGYGFDQFTIVVHANTMNVTAATLPIEEFSINLAWINNDITEFEVPTVSYSSPENFIVDGTFMTEHSITATWTSVSDNPVDNFINSIYPVHFSVSPGLYHEHSETLLPADINPYDGTIIPEYTHDVYIIAGQYVYAELTWDDPTVDFDLMLVPEGTAYDNDIFGYMGADLDFGQIIEGVVEESGWYTIVVDYYGGPLTETTFELVFSAKSDPVLDIESTPGTAMTYDFVAEGAQVASYIVSTSTMGWNFDRHSMTSVVYDVDDPVFTKTPESNYTLIVGNQIQLNWEIVEPFGGNYDLKLNDSKYLDYTGAFTDKSIKFYFSEDTVGEYVFTMDLSDTMGHTASNTVKIYVEEEKKRINGYSVGFMMVAGISTILYIVKKRRRS